MKKLFTIKREYGDFNKTIGYGEMLHSPSKDHIEIDDKKYETINSQGIYESIVELYKNSTAAFLSQKFDRSRK